MRTINPKIKLGYLVSASIGELTRLDVDFLSVSSAVLDRKLRSKADTRGLSIACWTVNTRDTMISAIARGADELVTDSVVTNPPAARGAVVATSRDPSVGHATASGSAPRLIRTADLLIRSHLPSRLRR